MGVYGSLSPQIKSSVSDWRRRSGRTQWASQWSSGASWKHRTFPSATSPSPGPLTALWLPALGPMLCLCSTMTLPSVRPWGSSRWPRRVTVCLFWRSTVSAWRTVANTTAGWLSGKKPWLGTSSIRRARDQRTHPSWSCPSVSRERASVGCWVVLNQNWILAGGSTNSCLEEWELKAQQGKLLVGKSHSSWAGKNGPNLGNVSGWYQGWELGIFAKASGKLALFLPDFLHFVLQGARGFKLLILLAKLQQGVLLAWQWLLAHPGSSLHVEMFQWLLRHCCLAALAELSQKLFLNQRGCSPGFKEPVIAFSHAKIHASA